MHLSSRKVKVRFAKHPYLAPEHRRELLGHALPHLLDGGGVAHEGGGHLEALGRDVAHGRLDVVRDPLDEVGRVLVAHVELDLT